MIKKEQRKKEGMNNLLVLILVILAIILGYNFVSDILVIDKRIYIASFNVSDHSGFDLNSSALTFGLVSPGGAASRDLDITNDFNSKVKVNIRVNGNIKEYLVASENNFILNPNEFKRVSFAVYLPKEIQSKFYQGNVEIYLKRKIW